MTCNVFGGTVNLIQQQQKASVSERTTRVSGTVNVPTVGDRVRNDEASSNKLVANELTDVQPPVAGEGVSMISGSLS